MTADQKLDAWVRFAAKAMGVVNPHLPDEELDACIRKTADAMLALVEQREREGRFGEAVPRPESAAVVERLRSQMMEAGEILRPSELPTGFRDLWSAAEYRMKQLDKAESLLKEALAALVDNALIWHKKTDVLTRARQEGFEP